MKQMGLFLLSVLIALLLAGCGGSIDPGITPEGESPWPAHEFAGGQKEGSFTLVAVDAAEELDARTDDLRLSLSGTDENPRLLIATEGLPASSQLFLHLRYDAEAMRPMVTSAGRDVADTALFLGITSEPGIVVIGIVTPRLTESLSGELELAEIGFAAGAFVPARGATALDATSNKVEDLAFNLTNTDTLEWHYKNSGDYDQNSEVNIADLTPLGQHLGESVAPADFAVDSTFAPIDGDLNGELNIADITPIGSNFQDSVTDYIVQFSATGAAPYTTLAGASIAQTAGDGTGFLKYSLQLAAPTDGTFYVVLPMDGATNGPEASASNAVQYGGGVVITPEPPVNLSASEQNEQIVVTWQPPLGGPSPSGYNLYRGNTEADFTNGTALKINQNPLVAPSMGLNSGEFLPSQNHVFGAKTLSGAEESAFSNIYSYTPASPDECNPVTNVTGVDNGGFVELSWDAPATGLAVTQYQIARFASPPTDQTPGQPVVPPAAGETSVVTTFDASIPHWFGIRTQCDLVVSTQVVYQYEPEVTGGDITPPVWQGGTGIRSVEPEDGLVGISWFPAIDAETAPVEFYVYVVEDGQEFDWENPTQVYPANTLEANITSLTNFTTYKFAVRAVDSVTPLPNMTTNENFLNGTPQPFPNDGEILSVTSSDTTSVRMSGEEIPRIFSVSRGNDLTYSVWDGSISQWTSSDISPVLNMDSGTKAERKYHPQGLAVGDEIHVMFGTDSGVFEAFGDKDSDPATWTVKTVSTAVNSVFGIGFVYSAGGDYYACCFATDSSSEQIFYCDRDPSGDWGTPFSVIDPNSPGDDEVWQCDMAINDFDGSQWIVGAVGHASSSEDALKFWYATRENRLGTWTSANTGFGGDVMVVEIDPTINQPVVVCAEVREIASGFGDVPVSDATVFTWNGTNWLKQVLDSGDFSFDAGNADTLTTLTGQDPQLVFSPTGKAVALWTYLEFYTELLELSSTLSGDWRKSTRVLNTWGPPQSLVPFISSSNSVTTGEGYHHCVTCNLGAIDSGGYEEIAEKYSQRNNYVEGDLYYFREVWE